ncbi:MAG TPA: lipopolysaccharide heptosyltransferase II [Candidatus Brocadiia bacterium]|nr:lipopolysaccharide heptosyltransferase II [Candidatus Brocadiia bacterium]
MPRNREGVLVHLPNWLGDVVMATPVFRCLMENLPGEPRVALGRKKVLPILDGSPWFTEVWEAPDPVGAAAFVPPLSLISRIRRSGFRAGLILPNSFRSALPFFMAGVPTRVGYARDGRRMLLTRPVERFREGGKFKPTYMADYYLRLCKELGMSSSSAEPELFIPADAVSRADTLLDGLGASRDAGLILVCPGAGFGPSKLWREDRFAAVADALSEEYGVTIILAAAPSDARITAAISGLARKRLLDTATIGVDLNVFKELVRRSRLVITLDSGPRHFAVALKRPAVTLIGPTDPRYARYPGEKGLEVRMPPPCAPCQEKTCREGHHRCMEDITVEMALDACRRILSSHD